MPTKHRHRSSPPYTSSAPTLSLLYRWLKDFDLLVLSERDREELATLAAACPDLSARNCALVWIQMHRRAIPIGPVRGFIVWKSMERRIVRDSKALYLIAPCRRRTRDDDESDAEANEDEGAMHFKPAPRFAYAQTVAASPDDGDVASARDDDGVIAEEDDAEEAVYQCWECGRLLTAEQTVAGGTANYCLECAAQIPQLS